MKRRVEIGILYSRSGNYRLVSDACRSGALAAIASINADHDHPIEFIAVEHERGYAQLRSPALGWQISVEDAARRIVAMAEQEGSDDRSHLA